MGWLFGKKNKSKNNKAAKTPPTVPAKLPAGPPERADVITQALANARAARERLGEETIQKIAEAIQKKQNSPMEQAKMKLARQDADRVADEILSMLETRH